MAWQKGESGNPNGRPRANNGLTDALRKLGGAKAPGDKVARKERLADIVWHKALHGDLAAAKLIYDRTEGTPPQSVTVKGDADNPLAITTQVVTSGNRPRAG